MNHDSPYRSHCLSLLIHPLLNYFLAFCVHLYHFSFLCSLSAFEDLWVKRQVMCVRMEFRQTFCFSWTSNRKEEFIIAQIHMGNTVRILWKMMVAIQLYLVQCHNIVMLREKSKDNWMTCVLLKESCDQLILSKTQITFYLELIYQIHAKTFLQSV